MAYKVNQDDCVGCGACADQCPAEAIELGEKASINPEKCLECGGCEAACPSGAITLE